MKYLIMSDLHGGAVQVEKALSFYKYFACDAIILLGDLLNHGPRNRLPNSYNPPSVCTVLNKYANEIIAIRGNCDSEVDSMMFNFPCNAPYYILFLNTEEGIKKLFFTHGHLFDFNDPKSLEKIGLKCGDIVISGHTHIAGIFDLPGGILNINPGSTTIPKGKTKPGFAILDENAITLYDLEAQVVACHEFKSNLT